MLGIMARDTYLKHWRKHRGYTQDDVVNRLAALDDPMLPQTAASLSRLENGKQPYSQRILEALADIYSCEPDQLIGHHPERAGDIIDMVAHLDDRKRQQAIAIIDALIRADGTNG